MFIKTLLDVTGSTIGVADDLARLTLAPVQISADLVRAVTKPAADAVEGEANAVRQAIENRD